jgi:hypothetical protein
MMALDPVYSLAVAWMLAFVFAAAGIHKVADYPRHVAVVADYRVAPHWLAALLAPLVIALELATAGLVLWPAVRGWGFLLAAALLLVYAASIGLNLLRGRTAIDCGCGWGTHAQRLSGWLVLRNVLLLLVTAVVALAPVTERPLNWADGCLIGFAGLAGMAVYAIGDSLIASWMKVSQLKSVHG